MRNESFSFLNNILVLKTESLPSQARDKPINFALKRPFCTAGGHDCCLRSGLCAASVAARTPRTVRHIHPSSFSFSAFSLFRHYRHLATSLLASRLFCTCVFHTEIALLSRSNLAALHQHREIAVAAHSCILFTLINAILGPPAPGEGIASWMRTGEMRSLRVTFSDTE